MFTKCKIKKRQKMRKIGATYSIEAPQLLQNLSPGLNIEPQYGQNP